MAFVLPIKEAKKLGSKHSLPGKQRGCLGIQQPSCCHEATASDPGHSRKAVLGPSQQLPSLRLLICMYWAFARLLLALLGHS